MNDLFAKISFDSRLLENCTSTVMDVDELVKVATSMTSQHFDSLKSMFPPAMGKSDSTSMLPRWLGLPVEPTDPYQEGKISFFFFGLKIKHQKLYKSKRK